MYWYPCKHEHSPDGSATSPLPSSKQASPLRIQATWCNAASAAAQREAALPTHTACPQLERQLDAVEYAGGSCLKPGAAATARRPQTRNPCGQAGQTLSYARRRGGRGQRVTQTQAALPVNWSLLLDMKGHSDNKEVPTFLRQIPSSAGCRDEHPTVPNHRLTEEAVASPSA